MVPSLDSQLLEYTQDLQERNNLLQSNLPAVAQQHLTPQIDLFLSGPSGPSGHTLLDNSFPAELSPLDQSRPHAPSEGRVQMSPEGGQGQGRVPIILAARLVWSLDRSGRV